MCVDNYVMMIETRFAEPVDGFVLTEEGEFKASGQNAIDKGNTETTQILLVARYLLVVIRSKSVTMVLCYFFSLPSKCFASISFPATGSFIYSHV